MPAEAIAILFVVALAAAVQVVSGFGFSLICVPLLAFAVGTKDAVVVAAVLGFATSSAQAVHERAHREWPTASRMLIGAAAGSPLGLLILEVCPARALRAMLGVAVLAFVALLRRGLTLHAHGPRVDATAGALSGVLNTSIGTNGPPLVAVLTARSLSPSVFRATISTVFCGSSMVTIALFAAAGRFDRTIGQALLAAAPALLVGTACGWGLRPRIDQRWFRPLVLGLLTATGVVALVSVAVTGA